MHTGSVETLEASLGLDARFLVFHQIFFIHRDIFL
jgi:hypothetical protein